MKFTDYGDVIFSLGETKWLQQENSWFEVFTKPNLNEIYRLQSWSLILKEKPKGPSMKTKDLNIFNSHFTQKIQVMIPKGLQENL